MGKLENTKQVCLLCSGTGLNINNEKCICGIEPVESNEYELDLVVPKLYKGQSDKVGLNQLIVNDDAENFNEFLRDMCEKLPVFPSLFIDTSETELGAYEVYYAIMEMVAKTGNNVLHKLNKYLWINEVFSEDRFKDVNQGIKQGREDNYNIIISDFEPSRYETLTKQVKVLKKSSRRPMSMYPLNMYHIKVRDK